MEAVRKGLASPDRKTPSRIWALHEAIPDRRKRLNREQKRVQLLGLHGSGMAAHNTNPEISPKPRISTPTSHGCNGNKLQSRKIKSNRENILQTKISHPPR